MKKTLLPLTIVFVAGAGVFGFLLLEYLGAELMSAHAVVATLFWGLAGAVVGEGFGDSPPE